MADEPKPRQDYYPCRKCGRLTHINDLDAKPELEDEGNENANFTRLECAECYGPGYMPGP